MAHGSLVRTALVALALLAVAAPAPAQEFTPIYDQYQCARFSDGKQFVVRLTPDGGFVVLRKARRAFAHETEEIRKRIRKFEKWIELLEADRGGLVKFIKAMNKVLKVIFREEETLPTNLPPSEAEDKMRALVVRLQQRLDGLDAVGQLLDDCENQVDHTSPGVFVSVTVDVISIATVRNIYGGYRILADPIKHPNSTQPGGFQACVKIVHPNDPKIYRQFNGFDDENRCGTGTLKFEGVPPATCDAFIPEGKVGLILEGIIYNYTSLPNRTTEELLEEAKLRVLANLPTVTVLALVKDISHDEAVALCETF